MADTRNDVTVTAKTWTDLYAGSGIAVGTKVSVVNKGSGAINLVIKSSSPSASTLGIPVLPFMSAYVDSGASGLWAYSTNEKAGLVLVQE